MKYCEKCKKEYDTDNKFCEDCGEKLTEFVKSAVKHAENKSSNLKFLGIGVAVIFIIGLIYFTGFTGNMIKAGFPQKNCRDVQEQYTEQVPYTYTYSYSVVSSDVSKDYSLALGEYTVAKIVVSNKEDNGGNFNVNIIFNVNGNPVTKTVSKYISAHSTETFQETYDNKLGDTVTGQYTVSPPAETRYRNEVRYRTVQQCD